MSYWNFFEVSRNFQEFQDFSGISGVLRSILGFFFSLRAMTLTDSHKIHTEFHFTVLVAVSNIVDTHCFCEQYT
jgi:hypothetical protein